MSNVFLFANDAETTLAASVGTGATALVLSPGSGAKFPNPSAGQQFSVTLTDAATGLLTEIVYCTARTADVLTVVRAQEGTIAQSWTTGDNVANLLTAGQMSALTQAAPQQYTAAGTANALTLTPTPVVTSYVSGQTWNIIPAANNTGAATLNVSGVGAKAIVNPDGTALIAAAIVAGGLVQVVYQATLDKFVLFTGFNSALKSCLSGSFAFASINITGGALVGGTLGVTGSVNFSSTLSVADTATFSKASGTAVALPLGNLTWPGGTLTADGGSGANVTITGFANSAVYSWNGLSATANWQVICGGSGGVILNNGATAWAAISDYRAKTVKGAFSSSGEIIDNVPVHLAAMKDAPDTYKAMFLAHELQASLPYAVTGEKDGEEMQTIQSTDPLVPILWAELREVRARLAALEASILK